MHVGRSYHTATLLTDGRVLVAGGIGNDEASAERYDPATGKWSVTGSMERGRYLHTATLLRNGQVLVAGGVGGPKKAEQYDPATGSWTRTDDLEPGRYAHTATLLPNGAVLVTGGLAASGTPLASAIAYQLGPQMLDIP